MKRVNTLWLPLNFYKLFDETASKEMSNRHQLEFERNRWISNEVNYDVDKALEFWKTNKAQFTNMVEELIICGESSMDGVKDAVINIRNGIPMPDYEFDEKTFAKHLLKVLKLSTIYKMMKIAKLPTWAIKQSIKQAVRKEYGPEERKT